VAVIAPLFAFIGRFVGRFLNMAFGWATTMLFGRVPQSRQLLLSAVALGAIVWLATLLGVLIPDVGAFLIAAVPAPDFVGDELVRLAMLVAALVLPLLIGIAGLFLVDPEDRPPDVAGRVRQALRGYPYAAVLALTIVFLVVVAPIRKARTILKRWSDAHIPMVVKPGGYDRVADDLERALDEAGLGIARAAAPAVLELPSKLLAAVGGASVRRLVPDRVLVLKQPALEVTIHPSDIAISGARAELARARAAIASRITFTAAYLTTTKESQDLEDRIERVSGLDAALDPAAVQRELTAIDRRLASLEIPYEEWEVVYRQRLQVDRDLLRRTIASPRAGGERDPGLLDRAVSAAKGLLPG
jgi:hypothetical protein